MLLMIDDEKEGNRASNWTDQETIKPSELDVRMQVNRHCNVHGHYWYDYKLELSVD